MKAALRHGRGENMSRDQRGIRFAGADDGHFGIKVFTDDGQRIYVPSRVSNGAQIISIGDGADDNMYDAGDGHTYTVSEDLPPIDTRFGDYGLSDINRVLVNHALIKAGLGGQDIRLVTGLPVADYYVGNAQNSDFIERKVKSLMDHRVANRNPAVKCANIVGHSVVSEAIAAFFDLLINEDGTFNSTIKDMVADGPIGMADIGGKTTDSAVIINGGKGIDGSRSGTARLGALSLNDAVEARIKHKFALDTLTPARVERAVMSGKLRIFNEEHDVSDLVNAEKHALASQIIAEIKRKFRDAADLECVFFVGGGALLLRDQLADIYPHAKVVDDPQFANARGMLKIAKYLKN